MGQAAEPLCPRRTHMEQMLICLSIALIAGLLMSRLAKAVNLPAVTSYLVAGLLLGPFVLGRLGLSGLGIGFGSLEQVEGYGVVTQVALGFIAFVIGNEFRLSSLRSMGQQAITVGIAQAVITTALVDVALVGVHLLFPQVLSLASAITLGSIAAATAPAATLMVVKQYKAKGPLTHLLLMVVAIDDAVGLVLFSASYGVANALEQGHMDLLSVVVEPLMEILLSLLLWSGTGSSWAAAGTFLACLLLAVAMTLLATRLLTATVLRGQPSAFTLELPPYRMPRVGQVLIRSLLDRTLFVLGRAVTVATPAGLVIWTLANVTAGGVSLLSRAAAFFDPLGHLMGLDGMVLTAFLLGFPANEFVLPALLMGYLHTGSLVETGGTAALSQLLSAQGWTAETAVCMMVLCLLHFPCGTTCLTIRRETGSRRWTLLAAALPTAMGMALCIAIHGVWTLLA